MFTARVSVAILLLLGLLCADLAAATNSYQGNTPVAGANPGEIDVQGTATPDACWTLQESGLAIAWPDQMGGGVISPNAGTVVTVNTCTGSWGKTTISGLKSGQKYWVVVQVQQKLGATVQTI
jgi:hypothetical protein